MAIRHRVPISKDSSMRAEVYQKLHEFNLHIEQGVAALREMAAVKEINAKEVRRMAEFFEEARTEASGYVASIVSGEEEREAGRLFGRRRRQEMAEDPLHGGWLEEERAKEREKELRKAKRARKRNLGKKIKRGLLSSRAKS